MVPFAGSLATRAACALAGEAGPRSTQSSPKRRPAQAAETLRARGRSTVMCAMLPDRCQTTAGRVVVAPGWIVPAAGEVCVPRTIAARDGLDDRPDHRAGAA